MLPVVGILVTLLYIVLIQELFSYGLDDAFKGRQPKNTTSTSSMGRERHKIQNVTKKNIHNLDTLWKRMCQANEHIKLNGIKQAMITEAMAHARELRRLETCNLIDT
ncbi:uncharacterized protein LOC141898383 [Tubulanus polymorphus]|uniref:uncharacterized protein LOC141898383 n=1 Tax=Tubulanus polymorphus TaxID=672921 RepID=UPI003DA4B855